MSSPMLSIDFSVRSTLAFTSTQLFLSQSARFPRRKSFVLTRLRPLFLSLRSFARSLPLFSIACTLFCKNTRVGGTSASLHVLCVSLPCLSRASREASKGALSLCPSIFYSRVFISLQIPLPTSVLFSHRYRTPGDVTLPTGFLPRLTEPPSYGQG